MAERGGQPGNTNATKNKWWSGALNRALLANDGEKLRTLAEKLIQRAEEGDIAALKEIGDRMDGKAAQQVIVAGDQENPVVTKIVREVVKP